MREILQCNFRRETNLRPRVTGHAMAAHQNGAVPQPSCCYLHRCFQIINNVVNDSVVQTELKPIVKTKAQILKQTCVQFKCKFIYSLSKY